MIKNNDLFGSLLFCQCAALRALVTFHCAPLALMNVPVRQARGVLGKVVYAKLASAAVGSV